MLGGLGHTVPEGAQTGLLPTGLTICGQSCLSPPRVHPVDFHQCLLWCCPCASPGLLHVTADLFWWWRGQGCPSGGERSVLTGWHSLLCHFVMSLFSILYKNGPIIPRCEVTGDLYFALSSWNISPRVPLTCDELPACPLSCKPRALAGRPTLEQNTPTTCVTSGRPPSLSVSESSVLKA